MPVDRSQYRIDLKTSADTGGLEKVMASAHDAREAFELLRAGAAEALGPVGQLIRFLENPHLPAAVGAALIGKTLTQESPAAPQPAIDPIHKSMQLRAAEPLQPIPSANDPVKNNPSVLEAQDPSNGAGDEAQRLLALAGPGRAAENSAEDEILRLQRLNPSRPQSLGGALTGQDTVASAGATAADVRDSITRAQQHIGGIDTQPPDRPGGHASPQEVTKLIELNDALIGLHENQAAQHGRLLDKIDTMINRVAALEAAQRNNRWQSQ